MIIALPVEGMTKDDKVAQVFGRAPYFMFYDTESGKETFVSNPAVKSEGGSGVKAAQVVVDNKAGALLTPRCGDNAARVFEASGIKLYKSADSSACDNIEMFKKGELSILEDIHPGHHGGGHENSRT